MARTLRLNASVLRSKIARPPAFVELSLPMAVSECECAIELSMARGKMRLELRAMPVAAIAELARALSS